MFATSLTCRPDRRRADWRNGVASSTHTCGKTAALLSCGDDNNRACRLSRTILRKKVGRRIAPGPRKVDMGGSGLPPPVILSPIRGGSYLPGNRQIDPLLSHHRFITADSTLSQPPLAPPAVSCRTAITLRRRPDSPLTSHRQTKSHGTRPTTARHPIAECSVWP